MASKRRKRRPLSAKVPLQVRLSASLHRQLKQAAKRYGNSLNGEIVRRLENYEVRQALLRSIARGLVHHGQQAQEGAPAQDRAAASQRPPETADG